MPVLLKSRNFRSANISDLKAGICSASQPKLIWDNKTMYYTSQ